MWLAMMYTEMCQDSIIIIIIKGGENMKLFLDFLPIPLFIWILFLIDKNY